MRDTYNFKTTVRYACDMCDGASIILKHDNIIRKRVFTWCSECRKYTYHKHKNGDDI